MFKAIGNKVIYLKRIEMGNLKLDTDMELGQYRELSQKEINLLKNK